MRINRTTAMLASAAVALGVAACGGDEGGGGGGGSAGSESQQDLQGTIQLDGSSTVFPFAQAAAELFMGENPGVQVVVGQSGTGGGFEAFCAGDIDISDASREIDQEEVQACEQNSIQFEQLSVANDGISIVTNPALPIKCMTTDELSRLWENDEVSNYSQINPEFPDAPVSLYGPGSDSGTFEFFTETINGEEGKTRTDYQASEDDNVLVQGVAGDKNGLGYFGFSYYEANQDKLNLVAVDDGDGQCVPPSQEAIQNRTYEPLSRSLFMYPSDKALQRPEVRAFLEFVINNNQEIAEAAQIVPLTDQQKQEALQTIEQLASGAGGSGGSSSGGSSPE